ncbi:BLOC-1-related complex subunit 7 isoform X3 [Motacilla alba alba]|uniref:BLOC-1-related complex subunit 7 isoform X3 n=1 Tax=Motacilla alba alba TaxID=1094192 RepID=UPI0018D4F29E|nr:BLOC-1-related complex subunit 7 isoform X3 [Motacilla alba alba]
MVTAPGSSCEKHGDARRCHLALGRCIHSLFCSSQSLRKMAIITTHLQYQQEAIQKKQHNTDLTMNLLLLGAQRGALIKPSGPAESLAEMRGS